MKKILGFCFSDDTGRGNIASFSSKKRSLKKAKEEVLEQIVEHCERCDLKPIGDEVLVLIPNNAESFKVNFADGYASCDGDGFSAHWSDESEPDELESLEEDVCSLTVDGKEIKTWQLQSAD